MSIVDQGIQIAKNLSGRKGAKRRDVDENSGFVDKIRGFLVSKENEASDLHKYEPPSLLQVLKLPALEVRWLSSHEPK